MANKNIFNSIQLKKPNRNHFDLSHDIKFTGRMGDLMPICCLETVPGDSFHISAESLIRFAPLIAPVMHRFDASIHYFFVPNRILWPNWEKFITGDKIPQGAEYLPPTVQVENLQEPQSERLAHLLGLPLLNAGADVIVNALPFAAYQRIWHEYYRDQNLIVQDPISLTDGPQVDSGPLTTIRKRAWTHDYFTSALPWAQKGESVDIPLGDVTLKPDMYGTPTTWKDATGADQSGVFSTDAGSNQIDGTPVAYDPQGTLGTEPTTINDLRRAFKLQEWLEKNARAGTRYVESILAHFGVKSSDARLQRPEYIVGTKTPIVISEVLNTTGEVSGLPQGNMSGHAVGVTNGKLGNFRCEEHGYIIGIMSVMPQPAYFQGIPRHFLKNDRLDYFWPAFAHIGEQAVTNNELYVQGNYVDTETFGYVPRYAEYKYMPNRIAGEFMESLDFWHEARKFATPPALNQQFVECNPSGRIFAVDPSVQDPLYINVLNRISALRPMPTFGNPSF
jgi:hypothetical protein